MDLKIHDRQLPYAVTVAVISFISYIVAGLVKSPMKSMAVALLITLVVLGILKFISNAKNSVIAEN